MKKFLFLVTAAILNGGRVCLTQFWKGPWPKDHPCQVWFNLVQRFQRRRDLNVIFYQNIPNWHNRYKSVERKISQKNLEYTLKYSFLCSCSKNLSSVTFKIKQQWKIEEISIFSNSSHLEWRAGLSDTILKGTHPRTIPARFGLI